MPAFVIVEPPALMPAVVKNAPFESVTPVDPIVVPEPAVPKVAEVKTGVRLIPIVTLPFSPESSTATYRPNVGDPRRMSTATSSTAPSTTRTSFPCACSPRWKWSPRSTP